MVFKHYFLFNSSLHSVIGSRCILYPVLNLLYSVRNELTGLAIAALMAWKLTVNKATASATNPAAINIHQPIVILYAKSSNHLCINHHASGKANTAEIITSLRKSFDNMETILVTVAPSTFLTPISFVLCSAI